MLYRNRQHRLSIITTMKNFGAYPIIAWTTSPPLSIQFNVCSTPFSLSAPVEFVPIHLLIAETY